MAMAPTINPFLQASYTSGYYYAPTSPASIASSSYSAGTSTSASGALVVYSPNSLHGLWFNDQVHGPFANGRQVNPFTPGLSPVSAVPKPTYAVEDPLRDMYPASRAADDPLNWITKELLEFDSARQAVSQQRVPLRCQSMPPR